MKEETKNLTNMDIDNYIDKYLAGQLSEGEMDNFETRCLDDKDFFHKVDERERLREQVDYIIKKNSEQIFSEYAEKQPWQKEEKSVASIIGKIVQLWINVKPIWKFSLIPVGAAIILLMLLLSPVEEAFQTNSELEHELGLKNYRSLGVEILSPKQGKKFHDQVIFAWQADSNGSFELQILNNKAAIIYSTKTTETSYTFVDLLTPGLYYWKLHDREYPVYVGKFFIK